MRPHGWPNFADAMIALTFMTLVLGVLVAGYAGAYLDFRRWLRSLRRTLVCMANYLPHMPQWALRETPRCLLTFGLKLPCSEAQLLAAYRQHVKLLHPDHGGDKRLFLQLQQHFEQSLEVVREWQTRQLG